jgi:hypothetical protein
MKLETEMSFARKLKNENLQKIIVDSRKEKLSSTCINIESTF